MGGKPGTSLKAWTRFLSIPLTVSSATHHLSNCWPLAFDPGQVLKPKFYIHLSVIFKSPWKRAVTITGKIKDNFSKKNYVKFRLGKILFCAFFKIGIPFWWALKTQALFLRLLMAATLSNNIIWLCAKKVNHRDVSLTVLEPVSFSWRLRLVTKGVTTSLRGRNSAVLPFSVPVLLCDLKIVISPFLLWCAQMQKSYQDLLELLFSTLFFK